MAVKLPDIATQERPIPNAVGGLATYRADFGGGEQAGQALMQTGKQIEHAGDELYARAKVEQDKIDTLKAEDAFTKLRQQQLDLTVGDKTGYARLKGAAAVNTPVQKDWTQKFNEAATAIEQGLQTEEQKVKFRQRANVANLQFQEGILHHVIRESDVYAKEVFEGTIAGETRQATSQWQDPNAIALSLERIGAAVKAQADRNGWAPEMTEAARLKAQGAVHNAVIQQAIASGNYKYAEQWYQANKADIDLPTAKALEVAVRDGTQKQLSADYTGQYLALRDNSQGLTELADKVLADPVLDDTRKNTIRSHILTRLDRLDKQAETKRTMFDKEIEKGIAQVNSTTLAGFEPTLDQINPLISMSRGTRYEADVDQMVNTINMTRNFRKLPPDQQAAEITRMTLAARAGGTVDAKIKFSPTVEQYAGVIDSTAQATGVDSTVLRAQIAQESGGNRDALSPKGARGVSQFMPDTAKRYGVDPNDPESSIKGQGAYMKDLLTMFGGDYTKALAGYNWGENNVAAAQAKWGDNWLQHAPKETRDYVASIIKTAGGARAFKFDVQVIQRFQAIHDAQLKELKDSPVSYAVRQELVAKDDPAAQPLDMSDPAKLDYSTLQRRVGLARSLESQYGASFKPLTPEEVMLATSTLKTLDTQGRKQYFAGLYQKAINDFGPIVSGPKDELGGARAYKAIMAQIAPDNPVLAHAGIAAARGYSDPKAGAVADLILQGYRIMNPPTTQDGKPDSGKLRPLPPESKMRLDFDNIVRDAYAGNDEARSAYYQTAKAIYLALSSKSADADTTKLDSTRWAESIKMATGQIVDYKGKYTPIPWGLEPGDFKDRLSDNITGIVASGRLDPSMTRSKLSDMRLEPIRDGVYVFREGDTVLADKAGRAVIVDLNRAAPWTPNQVPNTAAPTQAELDVASRPYLGTPKRKAGTEGDFGLRPDGTRKGNGWLGVLQRPDGGVSTELSVRMDDVIGGREFPLLVPTLTKKEVDTVLALKDNERAPKAIMDKAIAHAEQRVRQGKSPFKD